MSFNEYINMRRKQLNMSVDELVRKSGIPKGTLSKITAGINTNPTLSTIEALCSALGCTIDEAVNNGKSAAPAEADKGDANKQKLINNYEKMNEAGQNCLVQYSDYLANKPENLKSTAQTVKSQIKVAARSGEFVTADNDEMEERFRKMRPVDDLE